MRQEVSPDLAFIVFILACAIERNRIALTHEGGLSIDGKLKFQAIIHLDRSIGLYRYDRRSVSPCLSDYVCRGFVFWVFSGFAGR